MTRPLVCRRTSPAIAAASAHHASHVGGSTRIRARPGTGDRPTCQWRRIPSLLSPCLLFLLFAAWSVTHLSSRVHAESSFYDDEVMSEAASIATTTPSVSLSFTMSGGGDFLQETLLQYSILRPDVSISVVDLPASHGRTGPQRSWYQLAGGNVDAAFVLFSPTDAVLAKWPDLFYAPMWATGGTAVYNLPGLEGKLILSTDTLGWIYTGNITRWDDPLLVALNPNITLPARDIIVVLQSDSLTLSHQFTSVTGESDEYFASLIPASYTPAWPYERYAAYQNESGVYGPANYVAVTPYSIGIAYVDVSMKMGASSARFINSAGYTVSASYASITAGLNERITLSTRNSSGGITYTYNPDVNGAGGPQAWPYVLSFTVVLPKKYTRQTCRTRAELAKFLRWMQSADNIRFSLCESQYAAMLSTAAESQLATGSAFDSLTCGISQSPINSGAITNIGVSGAAPATRHITARRVLLDAYSKLDGVVSYVYDNMDEDAAMDELVTAGSTTEIMWFVSMTMAGLYPGYYDKYVASGAIQLMHITVFGLTPRFYLPTAVTTVLEQMNNSLPLVLDMELLAQIFLGDVTTWTDSRMTARNPALTAAYDGLDANITLVLCGVGRATDKANTVLGNHLILRLNETDAFKNSGLTWTLPVNWTPIMDRLDAKGVSYILTDTEAEMESTIGTTDGAIGYIMAYENISLPENDFSMVRTVIAPNGSSVEVTIAPTPASFLVVASASTPSSDPSFAMNAATSTDYAFRDAWPIPMLHSLAIATDLNPDNTDGYSEETLCNRQKRAVGLAVWLCTDTTPVPASTMTGSAKTAQLPAWATFNQNVLNQCKCDGDPILYTPPVVWSLPSSADHAFVALAAIGCCFAIFCAIFVVRSRARAVIRTSGMYLQMAELTGALLVYASVILFTRTATSAVCQALSWTAGLGVPLLLSPIASKVMRIYHHHSQRRGLRSKVIKLVRLDMWVAAWTTVHIILLAVAEKDSGIFLVQTYTEAAADSADAAHEFTQCWIGDGRTTTLALVFFILDGALLVVGAATALVARHALSAFNEGTHLSRGLWNATAAMALCVILITALSSSHGTTPTVVIVLMVLWATNGFLLFSFNYKIRAIYGESIRAIMRYVGLPVDAKDELNNSSLTTTTTRSDTSSSGASSGTYDPKALFRMPPIDAMSVLALEAYITDAELQLRRALERRKSGIGVAPLSSGGSASVDRRGQFWLPSKSMKALIATVTPEETADDLPSMTLAEPTPRSDATSPVLVIRGSPVSSASPERAPRNGSTLGVPGRPPRQPIRVQTSKFATSPVSQSASLAAPMSASHAHASRSDSASPCDTDRRM